jgi:hypothetical protein
MTSSSYGNGNQLLSSSPAGYCQQQQHQAAVSAVQPSWQSNNDAGFPFCGGVFSERADFMQAAQPRQMTTGADHDKMLQDASAMAKKREERERAKQRYNEKKKNRR